MIDSDVMKQLRRWLQVDSRRYVKEVIYDEDDGFYVCLSRKGQKKFIWGTGVTPAEAFNKAIALAEADPDLFPQGGGQKLRP